MKQFNVLIPIYKWRITVFTNVENEEIPTLREFLTEIKVDSNIIDDTFLNLRNMENSGSTINNTALGLSIVCLTRCTSEHEVYEIISHEIQHVMDYISNKYAFMDEIECKGYLMGFIFKSLSEAGVISEMLNGISSAVNNPGIFVTQILTDAREMAGHLSAENYRKFLTQLQKEVDEYTSISLENLDQNSSKSNAL